ncbi:MAG TPA: transporter substrate-binding protein, partial [Candidatus Manganitrophaceae bacterium]|nr:transporter substrate-binding protein [Candidatus Manganitrophaceae bacterium]
MFGEKRSIEKLQKKKRSYLRPALLGLLSLLAVGAVGMFAVRQVANAAGEEKGPIKIGILHSLTGTMAISEQSIKDIMMMGIEEINAKGGVL